MATSFVNPPLQQPVVPTTTWMWGVSGIFVGKRKIQSAVKNVRHLSEGIEILTYCPPHFHMPKSMHYPLRLFWERKKRQLSLRPFLRFHMDFKQLATFTAHFRKRDCINLYYLNKLWSRITYCALIDARARSLRIIKTMFQVRQIVTLKKIYR